MAIGLQPYNYQPAYGGIPQLTSPTTTASSAIAGNVANLPQLGTLVRGINPQYQTQQDIIGEELAGTVPSDVVSQLRQQAAERGLAIGAPGSDNVLSNYLTRFLGTSYGIQRQGMSEANTLGQLTAEMMRPYMVTAEDQQAAEAMQSIYNAAPVPSEAAKAAEDAIKRAYDLYGQDMISGAGGGSGGRFTTQGTAPSYRPAPTSAGGVNYPQVVMGATPGTYEPITPSHGNQRFDALTGTWYTPTTASVPSTSTGGLDYSPINFGANQTNFDLWNAGNPGTQTFMGGGYNADLWGYQTPTMMGYNLGDMAGLTGSQPYSPPFLGSMGGWGGTPYTPTGSAASDPYYALDLFSPEWNTYMGFDDSGGYYADAGGGE